MVITGAAGFLGRHLIPALAQAGARVLALDLAPAWEGLPAGVVWQQADLLTPAGAEAALADLPGDPASAVLFHLAAMSMPVECSQNPEQARAVNGNMALVVGDAWAARGGGRLVFTSSILVYQPFEDGRDLGEDDPVATECSPYTTAKLAAEEGLASLSDKTGVEVDIARLSQVYGPDAHPQSVIVEIMDKARSGQSPTMRRPGEELDFIHVDDVVAGLMRLAALEHPGGCRRTNLSTGKGWRVAQAARIIARLAGLELPPDDEKQAGFGYRLVLANRRLHQLTGWTPEIDLPTGLERVWRERTGLSD